MVRHSAPEILDTQILSDDVTTRIHRELTALHRALGNVAALERAIRRDSRPVRRVLDIGGGHGGVLAELRRRLAVEVVGVDLRPPADGDAEIVRADAVRDPLPKADIAFSLCMGQHLSEVELAG